jgi:hypothetical protein
MRYEEEAKAAEADTAARYKRIEESKSVLETAIEWLDPIGIFESSLIALEPNFAQIHARQAAAINAAEQELGRSLSQEERDAIQQDIYNIWAEASLCYQAP